MGAAALVLPAARSKIHSHARTDYSLAINNKQQS